ncbi:class II aldolase/adducin family protein [Variovorax sp. KK3]|uniref:class II aldolase/adducin family protein n=1 Tax=Variovorax sp. KK3 TaxID=1855728 RepID=UPI00097C43F4|nr:class II aldolase/adducin family protein [Variovorax sp. KK3]
MPTAETTTASDPIRNAADAYAPRQAGLHFPRPPRFESLEAERLHRKQRLAAACRVFARAGFEYGFAGHVTVRDPQHPDRFWTNPFAMDLARVRVSDLLLVDHEGQVLEGSWTVNRAGFVLHAAIHAAHPQVVASCHMHSTNGMAWAAFGEPLAPLNQTACYFFEAQSVITEGSGRVALESGSADAIARELGDAKIAIHQNHGLFAVGRESVDEAAWWYLSAERACEIQLKVDASGRTPKLVDAERARHIAHQLATPSIAWLHFQPHYDAVCRSDPDLFD